MKEWAETEGYSVDYRMVKRKSRVKTESGIAGHISTSARELTAITEEMIARGDVNIGRLIYPIEATPVERVSRGACVVKHVQNPSRVIPLTHIVVTHLMLMKEKGLLNQTDCRVKTIQQLKEHLVEENSKCQFIEIYMWTHSHK